MRFSNAELPPFWGAAIRFLPASVLCFVAMVASRAATPRGAALLGAVIYGALNFGVSYALFYYGLQSATAGTASVMLATVPLWTFFLAIVHGLERFRSRALVGTLVAMLGVAIVFFEQLTANVPLVSLLAMIAGAVTAAESGVIAKRFPRTHPFSTNAVGMLVGGILLLALSLGVAEARPLPQRPETQLALVWLASVGAIGLFGLFLFVLGRWTVSATSLGNHLNDAVRRAKGSSFDDTEGPSRALPQGLARAAMVRGGSVANNWDWRRWALGQATRPASRAFPLLRVFVDGWERAKAAPDSP